MARVNQEGMWHLSGLDGLTECQRSSRDGMAAGWNRDRIKLCAHRQRIITG